MPINSLFFFLKRKKGEKEGEITQYPLPLVLQDRESRVKQEPPVCSIAVVTVGFLGFLVTYITTLYIYVSEGRL